MGKYFGTDGIRGAFGDPLINPEFAYRFGVAVGHYSIQKSKKSQVTAVIGRDTRESGPVLVNAIISGMNRSGLTVYDLGVVPTPAVAKILLRENADIGVVVTASHNPSSDNGFKLFSHSGCKLGTKDETYLEELIEQDLDLPEQIPPARADLIDGAAAYIEQIRGLLKKDSTADWKIVLDLANGATCGTSPEVLSHGGGELILIGKEPNGKNINAGVGSEHPMQLGETVRKHNATLGIAHDGDGDRIVVCDELGEPIDGDILLGLLALYAMEEGQLPGRTLVATLQSNLGLDRAVNEAGGRVLRADIGDRNVAQLMRESGANLGGESSGHIIFSDYATTGDGLLAAIKLIELMLYYRKPLSELKGRLALFPQETANLKVEKKRPLEALTHLNAAIRRAEGDLGTRGRVLVRYSGTEPKLRILVEAENSAQTSTTLMQIINAAKMDLNVIGG